MWVGKQIPQVALCAWLHSPPQVTCRPAGQRLWETGSSVLVATRACVSAPASLGSSEVVVRLFTVCIAVFPVVKMVWPPLECGVWYDPSV
jgi:hypothetical protein